MQSNQDTTQDLRKCTVAIRNSIGDKVLGTGVIVEDDGLILTCYHVIGDIDSKTINHKIVHVYFPSTPRVKGHANIIEEYSNPELDIAFLRLEEKLPEQTYIAILSESIEDGNVFKSFGFRRHTTFDGLNSYGRIDGKVNKKLKNGALSLDLIQLYSDGIDHGMSGAAVFDSQINRVIGIVSEYLATSSNVDRNLALAIPIKSVIKVYPELRNKNPGLLKFNNFLVAIGKGGSLLYDRFEDLYVPPIQYEEIEKALKENRCIFITGTPEYGKTYTAIKLLWEFYKNSNYIPSYIEEGSKKTNEVITSLINQDKSLENSVIYIEDPVGKTEYKHNKEFEESIESIIAGLGRLNAYLVVTMREEIYQKFNPIGKANLKKYIKKLNIANHSYDSKGRKDMLLRWATVMSCKWFQDDNLRKAVLEYIENDETKLPTPLNIKDFASETAGNSNFLHTEKLLEMVNKKSQRTPARFAQDIMEMEEHGERYKVLFLCFPFISDWFSTNFVETKYIELLKDLNIKDDYAFKRVRAAFQDKIEFSYYIRFSHPSYSEALPYLLLQKINDEEEEIPTKINDEVFSNVLIKLHSNIFAASDIAKTIASNFDKFPSNVKDLLFDMANNTILSEAVAEAIKNNFDKLPSDVSYKLFMNLISNDYKFWDIVQDVANSIALIFDKLPENVRDLLFKMADNNSASVIISRTIIDNFDKLPEDTRNKLLLKVADNKDGARNIIDIILDKYDKLPENIRNELLLKLAANKDAAGGVASAVDRNFDKLHVSLRNELLLKLADNKDAVTTVAYTVAKNFYNLPENVQNLLVKLADNKYAASGVADAVYRNFDNLPENVQNLLFKLPDNKDAAWIVSQVSKLPDNFDKLPEGVRNKFLIKLADNKDASGRVASAVADNFDKLPENIRNELLLKLAANKDAAGGVASAVANNFDKLPENVQNLLVKLADNKETAEAVAVNFDKLPENVRIELQKILAKHGYRFLDMWFEFE